MYSQVSPSVGPNTLKPRTLPEQGMGAKMCTPRKADGDSEEGPEGVRGRGSRARRDGPDGGGGYWNISTISS